MRARSAGTSRSSQLVPTARPAGSPVSAHQRSLTNTARPLASLWTMPTGATLASASNGASAVVPMFPPLPLFVLLPLFALFALFALLPAVSGLAPRTPPVVPVPVGAAPMPCPPVSIQLQKVRVLPQPPRNQRAPG